MPKTLYDHIKWMHSSISVKDPKSLAEWYRDVLGFKISLVLEREGRPPVFYMKFKNGSEIEVSPKIFEEHTGFIVDDFDEAAKLLKSKGITLKGVRVTSAGWKAGHFYDPEGNLLELVMRPKDTPQT